MAKKKTQQLPTGHHYDGLLSSVTELLEQARRASARVVNAVITATYWEVGRRIVEFEQQGQMRADYGDAVISQLSLDLTRRFGRGFGPVNLSQMRKFYQFWSKNRIFQTLSEKSQTQAGRSESTDIGQTRSGISASLAIPQTLSAESDILHTSSEQFTLQQLGMAFPLPWSQYVRLLSVKSPEARAFYESEAIRGGWSVRQLDRQIAAQFFERTALSKTHDPTGNLGQRIDDHFVER